jgi:hypothetical protein
MIDENAHTRNKGGGYIRNPFTMSEHMQRCLPSVLSTLKSITAPYHPNTTHIRKIKSHYGSKGNCGMLLENIMRNN